MPAGIDAAPTHDHIAFQRDPARERYCLEAVAQMQSASLGEGIGDQIIGHGDVMAAVNGHPVRQDGCDDGVMPNDEVMIGEFFGPRRNAVVAIVAKEAVLDDDIRNAAVQIESVRGGIQNTDVADAQTVEGAIEPQSNLDVLNE